MIWQSINNKYGVSLIIEHGVYIHRNLTLWKKTKATRNSTTSQNRVNSRNKLYNKSSYRVTDDRLSPKFGTKFQRGVPPMFEETEISL